MGPEFSAPSRIFIFRKEDFRTDAGSKRETVNCELLICWFQVQILAGPPFVFNDLTSSCSMVVSGLRPIQCPISTKSDALAYSSKQRIAACFAFSKTGFLNLRETPSDATDHGLFHRTGLPDSTEFPSPALERANALI
jgi:hypothetical protein